MSRLPFELVLALRYLVPKRTFVSFITLISICGVTVGVAVLIVVISVMSGFDKEWQERILGFNAHAKIVDRDFGPMGNHDELRREVMSVPHVVGASPFILDQVMVETQPETGEPEIAAPFVRGIDPATEGQVSIIPNSIVQGHFDVEDYGVLVGREFAWQMGLRVGDRISIYSRKDLMTMRKHRGREDEVAILPEDYEIRGIFDVRFADYNQSIIFTSLEQAQTMNGWEEDQAHGLLLKLDDPFRARKVESELTRQLDSAHRVRIWMDEYSEIFGALVVEKNMIRFLLFFIVLVAAFGITSSLITFVVQKTREIGVLRALGATATQIMALFLGQCLIVGVIGVSAGLCLGLALIRYRNEFLTLMNRVTGQDLLPPAIYKVYELPVLVLTHDLVVICGVSLAICLLAGFIPAWIAGRLQPVEALRHE